MVIRLAPFGGLVTTVDERNIPDNAASDLLNVRIEDADIRFRYGYKSIEAAQSNFSSAHGLAYIQGYNSSDALVEEYVSFERLSTHTAGKCKPYSRHVTTGAATEITNGGSPQEVTNTGEWRGVAWDDVSYFCNPNETQSVWKHTIGTTTSFSAVAPPTAPAAAPTYTITVPPYTELSFAGIDPATEITYTGSATSTNSSLNTDNTLTIGHTANSTLQSSFKVDLNGATAGVQDWSYNDIFAFRLSMASGSPFRIDSGSIQLSLVNNDGSPLTFTPTKLDVEEDAVIPGQIVYWVRAEFSNKARASWDNVRYFQVTYNVTASSLFANQNKLTISKPYIGGMRYLPDPGRARGNLFSVAYSFYNSTNTYESGLSPALEISADTNSPLWGQRVFPQLEGLGTLITFNTVVSSEADKIRIYVMDEDGKWRRVVEQNDTTTTYQYRTAWEELGLLTAYQNIVPFNFTKAIAGIPFKGWMVWLYQGGFQNVRHSRVGEPEKQASDLDSPDDANVGATFSLADNFGDEPLTGFQADDSLILVGNHGVYAQSGDRPLSMTPPKRLPTSFGCPNPYAATRFTLDGQVGVAAVAKNGEGVYFYLVSESFNGQEGYAVIELTRDVRPELTSWLRDGQSLSNFSTAILTYEPNTDALWLIMGKRAMVLRRPDMVTGQRKWEKYEYTIASSATVKYAVTDVRNRMRWMRTTGQFDDVEWDSAAATWVKDTGRDDGSTPPAGYWQSKRFLGPRTRVFRAYCDRDMLTDTPSLIVYSEDKTKQYYWERFKKWLKLEPTQTGRSHKFRLVVDEEYAAPISDLQVEISGPIGERRE